jgi:hypothetical protein
MSACQTSVVSAEVKLGRKTAIRSVSHEVQLCGWMTSMQKVGGDAQARTGQFWLGQKPMVKTGAILVCPAISSKLAVMTKLGEGGEASRSTIQHALSPMSHKRA